MTILPNSTWWREMVNHPLMQDNDWRIFTNEIDHSFIMYVIDLPQKETLELKIFVRDVTPAVFKCDVISVTEEEFSKL